MREIVVLFLLFVGSFFLLIGSVGLIRLPDVFCRMHATTKSTTLGACSFFLATFVAFGPTSVGLKALLAILFLLMTAPVGAHMIARAAYRGRVPLTPRMVLDELSDLEIQSFYREEEPSEEAEERPS